MEGKGTKLRAGYLKVGQVANSGPHFLVGGAEIAKHAKELVNLAVAGEEGAAINHLRKYAAYRPNVDWCGVVLGAEEDFRGAVPKSNNLREGERYATLKKGK